MMGWESKSGTNRLCQALSVSLKINLVFIQSIKEIHMYSFWPIPLPEAGGSKIWLLRCCRPTGFRWVVSYLWMLRHNPPKPTLTYLRTQSLPFFVRDSREVQGVTWDRRKNGNREFSLTSLCALWSLWNLPVALRSREKKKLAPGYKAALSLSSILAQFSSSFATFMVTIIIIMV